MCARRTNHQCAFCGTDISRQDLWKVSIYPTQAHPTIESLTFRCCFKCSRNYFDTLLQKPRGKCLSQKGKYRHHCLYCGRGMKWPELWSVEAYPSRRHPKWAGEMVRCCEDCITDMLAPYRKRLPAVAAAD